MIRHKKIIIFGLVLLIIAGCSQRRLQSEKRFLLGTVVEVISPYPEAAEIAFSEIERIEKIFSANIKDSAISHLNRTGFLNTNFEVTSLIEKSGIFYGLTQGYFDITVAPLTKIWKEALIENKLPTKRKIRKKLALIGFKNIHIDKKNNSIKFKRKGMKIDLGGIAKGYAIDVAVKELKRKGIDSAIINAGGDIYCLGSKFGNPWKLGLQHPRKKDKILTTLELKDLAIATSGDYEQYMEIGGKRYSHIINPKTGYPVENDIVSVTVVAKDAVTADAVATCIFLLGKEKGMKVFENYEGVERIIIITKSDVQDN
ncbi:MAG: FAD:protein FMN transferase [Candidatus Omnitrophica bacterium]|nr:FAD:protein FMN transferase [Candidatus Omnitrophota bacterium]